jgi:hypothetical protein
MAVPLLLCGSETWTVKTEYMTRIQEAERKFLRSVKGRTIVDKIRNEARKKELEIFSKVYKRIRRLEYRHRMSPGKNTKTSIYALTNSKKRLGSTA